MFETLLEYFQSPFWSVWGPFWILILCGLGLPVPEDIVLIAAGALGVIVQRSWPETALLMYVGVLAGDSLTFVAGRYWGRRLLRTKTVRRIVSSRKQARVKVLFNRYGSSVLFVGRFLPGLRAPMFFTAGSMRVAYWRFLVFDGLAALLSVPVFVWLGHWLWTNFQDDLVALRRALLRTQHASLLVAGLIVAIVLLVFWIRSRRKRVVPPAKSP